MFKIGDKVKCIAAAGYAYLIDGAEYWVIGTSTSADGNACIIVAGVHSAHFASRFELIKPAAIPITITPSKVAFQQPRKDQAEARLMTVWKAVPDNCCSKCGPSTPLPCSYHPVGSLCADPNDVGF